MKFCLALFFQNEARWLRLHLPVLLQSGAVDGVVAVDGGSTDGGADVIRALGGVVYDRPFDYTDSGQNFLLECCEREGYEAVLHTAPDELWFPAHLDQMKRLLETHKALTFPTFNFQTDRQHYAPYAPYYPDKHLRAWRLEAGVRYPGSNHTQVTGAGWVVRADSNPGQRDVLECPHIHLFHYADIKPRWQRDLLAVNRLRADKSEAPLDTLPPDYIVSLHPFHIPFVGAQPLDPLIVGLRAPVEEDYGTDLNPEE